MQTQEHRLQPPGPLVSWQEDEAGQVRLQVVSASRSGASRPLLLVLATAALGVAVLVSRLVDAQVSGEFAVTFRLLWWLLLGFNVADAFSQRTRTEAWNTLLLKYVMVGVTYSILA
jgi:uncharacterized membrane protein YhaH (DUF805 family)